tara:strand:- start:167 stop:346 length:180 start_codon:yes stop_codon:yes gene_type:complete
MTAKLPKTTSHESRPPSGKDVVGAIGRVRFSAPASTLSADDPVDVMLLDNIPRMFSTVD